MRPWLVVTAAVVLAIERATYAFIARRPDAFRRLCRHPLVARLGEPVVIVRRLLYAFKALQFSTFAAWCLIHGDGHPLPAEPDAVVLGFAVVIIVAGQILNWSVFYRLGMIGVFYGDRLGHPVAWCRGFPFSLCPHPQYVGVVLTIWGFFLGARYPHDDWFLLPALETLYYAVGAYLEQERPHYPEPEPIGGRLT